MATGVHITSITIHILHHGKFPPLGKTIRSMQIRSPVKVIITCANLQASPHMSNSGTNILHTSLIIKTNYINCVDFIGIFDFFLP